MDQEILQSDGLEAALSRLEPRPSVLSSPLRSGPAADQLTDREQDILRKRYEYELEIEQSARLAELADKVLAQRFIELNALFRMATGEVFSQNSQILDPDHRQVCDVITDGLIDEYGVSSVENFRAVRGLLQEIANRSLKYQAPPEKKEENEPTYEIKRRKIPWGPRLKGYEETVERVD